MDTKHFWKITGEDGLVILTDVPPTYRNGDGVYFLMKELQKIYGPHLCGQQKFDGRFDKLRDFDIILKTGYNLSGTRLISAHLFEYDKEKGILTVNRSKSFRIVQDWKYTYQIQKTQIRCIDGWNGLRKFILGTMGDTSCDSNWGDSQFGEQKIIPLDRI